MEPLTPVQGIPKRGQGFGVQGLWIYMFPSFHSDQCSFLAQSSGNLKLKRSVAISAWNGRPQPKSLPLDSEPQALKPQTVKPKP